MAQNKKRLPKVLWLSLIFLSGVFVLVRCGYVTTDVHTPPPEEPSIESSATTQARDNIAQVRLLAEELDDRLRKPMSKENLVILLRDHVYWAPSAESRAEVPVQYVASFDYLSNYKEVFQDKEKYIICDGQSFYYQVLLEAYGLPSRRIDMWNTNEWTEEWEKRTGRPRLSHASTEVFLDGRWVASCAHYNIMFEGKDGFLSWKDALHNLHTGKEVAFTTNGMERKPHFPTPEQALVDDSLVGANEIAFLRISPAKVFVNGTLKEFPLELVPSTWDGYFDVEEGEKVHRLDIAEQVLWLQDGRLRQTASNP